MDTYKDAIFIDGLVISKFSRAVFEDMKKGGITAANCTCSVWHNFQDTMSNIAQWKYWFREWDDILLQVHDVKDIEQAKADEKVGIILGWQNTSGIDNDLDNLILFRDLGVRIIQLTYNSQNLVGAGCWETNDSGLTDFGHEVVSAMNDLGILIDLSHVGPKTSDDAIKYSKRPVAYTHCCPMLKQHARNKTDEQLRTIAKANGFVGFASYTPFLPKGEDSTLADCVSAIDYVINIVGENRVGIERIGFKIKTLISSLICHLTKVRVNQRRHHTRKFQVCRMDWRVWVILEILFLQWKKRGGRKKRFEKS